MGRALNQERTVKTGEQGREDRVIAARERMAELSAKFVDRTKSELQTLRQALDAGTAASIGEIHYLAHRMAGTGATLGFESLADHAARIEEICERQASGAALDAQDREEIAAAVGAIDAELRALEGARRA